MPLRHYASTASTPLCHYASSAITAITPVRPLCHYAITPVRSLRPLRQYNHYAITPLCHYAITPLRHYASSAITPLCHYASTAITAITPVRPLCHSPHSLASVKDMYVEMGFPLNLYWHQSKPPIMMQTQIQATNMRWGGTALKSLQPCLVSMPSTTICDNWLSHYNCQTEMWSPNLDDWKRNLARDNQ